jgi:hypothetical protein
LTKYNSPFSVSHRKTIFIDAKDPRVNSEANLDKARARLGSDVEIVNTGTPIEIQDYNDEV